jgi:hypothetical protein
VHNCPGLDATDVPEPTSERLSTDYQPYAEHLNELVRALVHGGPSATEVNAEAVDEALGDGAPAALRRLGALQDRQHTGAFFASPELADLAWGPLLPTIDKNSIIVDPSCGAGSLLIPPLRTLLSHADPLRAADQIRGCDLVSAFIEATRARLMLTVASSQPSLEQWDLGNLQFPWVQQGNALMRMEQLLDGATHIALSPPYEEVTAPAGCTWGKGKITQAALFTEAAVRHMPVDSRMVVILPKILQKGRRYAKWRHVIRQMANVDQVIDWGIFDSHSWDVVFLMYLTKRRTAQSPIPRGLSGWSRSVATRWGRP